MQILSFEQIDEAAQLIKEGELVAFPTETVYGLGASVYDEKAVAKIYAAKGRPADNPLIVHISSFVELQKIAQEIPPQLRLLAKAFWPGPLTVLLKRHPDFPAYVCAGLDTVAVRMPAHPGARALIERAGAPLAAPSANLSGKPSATEAQHVCHDFAGKIAAVIDGGSCSYGIESTVISLVSGDQPVLLRPGAITKEELETVLQCEITEYKGQRVISPGMKYKHYAPDAPLRFFSNIEEIRAYLAGSTKKRMLLTASEKIEHPGVQTFHLTMQNLYATLRLCDLEKYEEVLVLCDEELLHETALMNRLNHAAEHESSSHR